MPATSPTLSPTLSAMVAGLRGIVLGDAGLDLAHQVGADVGGLGVDAAAHTGEEGDGTGAEAEAGDDVDDLRQVAVKNTEVDDGQDGDAQNAEADDREAHHRAAGEGDVEGIVEAGAGGGGGTHVGGGGHAHAEEAGEAGAQGADDDGHTDEHRAVFAAEVGPGQEARDHDHENEQNAVFAAEEGHGAVADMARDLLHRVVAHVLLVDPGRTQEGEEQGQDARHGDGIQESLAIHWWSPYLWWCPAVAGHGRENETKTEGARRGCLARVKPRRPYRTCLTWSQTSAAAR